MRMRLVVRGSVGGVGFRPFVHRAAQAHGLTGWVQSGRDAVHIEVQGNDGAVRSFVHALETDLPEHAAIDTVEQASIEDRVESTFLVLGAGEPRAPILPPDLATCTACLEEITRHASRRYRYPFTSCASCGPRYSICTGQPYDRRHTSMRAFTMCSDCVREYDDTADRRHRAQPIACPSCGPELSLLGLDGRVLASGEEAITGALRILASSGILGLRSIGGFQLLCDATDARVVSRLRARKHRPGKPFPVMFRDRDELAASAEVSDDEWGVLSSPEAPIVLVPRRKECRLADEIGPGTSLVGAMLPYTPLHSLLLAGARGPLVCTSGNPADEPACTTSDQAVLALASIADGFLDHDRPIVRPIDDSIVRVTPRRSVVLRRARGYVPRGVGAIDPHLTVLALGARRAATVTLGHNGSLVPSQHLGDLDSEGTRQLLETTARDLCAFFGATPMVIACDAHPTYASSILAARLGEEWGVPLLTVQHHHAHVAAVVAEQALAVDRKVLGLAWDSGGLGSDDTVWGGEALVCHHADAEHFASIAPFPVVTGDRSSLDPRRAALGLLFEHLPSELERAPDWSAPERDACMQVLERKLAPMSSSMGALTSAIAALIGGAQRATFEGQAWMELEELASRTLPDGAYPFPLTNNPHSGLITGETRALVSAIVEDIRAGVDPRRIARRFHEALVSFGIAVAERAGIADVVLGGDVFQNRLLAERLEAGLERAGFAVHVPEVVPANDGGISVGQAWIAAQRVLI
jgi:hydrogenase maturation protein HypF